MLNLLVIIIAFGILVTIHEGGHYLMARFFKVDIEKFSIGFGPKILSKKVGMTEFRLSLIPLGGYVKMSGENPNEAHLENKNSFLAKKWWQKALIAFAGPFANLILAIIMMILTFWIGQTYFDLPAKIGKSTSTEYGIKKGDIIKEINSNKILSWSKTYQYLNDEQNEILLERDGKLINKSLKINKKEWSNIFLPEVNAIVGEVAPGLPAYTSGIEINDKIIQVNNEPVSDWYEMREKIQASEKDKVNLTIQRDNKILEKTIKLQVNVIDDSRIIGITQKMPIKVDIDYTFVEGINNGFITTFTFIYFYYDALGKLIKNPSSLKDNIGGPVMLYSMSKQEVKKGLSSVLALFASISLILMIMNLLPIPILDGGQIIFSLLEGLLRKPLPISIQENLQKVGFLIIMGLMFFAFYNDFSKIFLRNFSNNKSNERVKTQVDSLK